MIRAQTPVTEDAPAKINLCLHVTGRRADGYHLLDSLVVFAGVGDRVTAASAPALASAPTLTLKPALTLKIVGPEAAALPQDDNNLVLRAGRAMGVPAALTLWKALPVASGIGGGSADAAATLRALAQLTGRALPDAKAVLSLGADVPVCLAGQPARMRGIGDKLSPLPPFPAMWVVLVNPRLPVPTPQVFAALTRRNNPPIPDLPPNALHSAADFAAWLTGYTRNDLSTAAHQVAPVLSQVEKTLAHTSGCLLARMSGSGGTHFGLFASEAAATAAAASLATSNPGWWVTSAAVLGA